MEFQKSKEGPTVYFPRKQQQQDVSPSSRRLTNNNTSLAMNCFRTLRHIIKETFLQASPSEDKSRPKLMFFMNFLVLFHLLLLSASDLAVYRESRQCKNSGPCNQYVKLDPPDQNGQQWEIENSEIDSIIKKTSFSFAIAASILILHTIYTVMLAFKSSFRQRFANFHIFWIIMIVAVPIHTSSLIIIDDVSWTNLHIHLYENHQVRIQESDVKFLNIDKIAKELLMQAAYNLIGMYFIFPMTIIATASRALQNQRSNGNVEDTTYQRRRNMAIIILLLLKVFPLWQIYTFFKQAFLLDHVIDTEVIPRYVGLEIAHILVVLWLENIFRFVNDGISSERRRVQIVELETQQLLEKLPEGILVVDMTGKVRFMNTELSSVLNMLPSQLQDPNAKGSGLQQRIFRQYNQDNDSPQQPSPPLKNHSKELCCLKQMIDDPDWNIEEEKYYEMELHDSSSKHETNKIFTQIRKLDIQYQEQPAKMLVIRNITFIIEYEKVQNESKYQELLTATMSHEMLTPLNSIINLSIYVEQKLKNRFKADSKAVSEGMKGANSAQDISDIKQSLNFIHIIRSSANILQYLIKDMIDLMNIKHNRFNAVTQDFQPLDACQEVIQCFEVQAREKAIHLRKRTNRDTHDKISTILGDKQRYQQILMNIIQNAVKFTYTGGVDIILDFISTADQSNNESGCSDCGKLLTMVKDTGIGIEPATVQRLFKIFGTISNTQQSNNALITTQGIGLGLSICKQLVEKLGGMISINSVPLEGTDVTFMVPFKCEFCSKVACRRRQHLHSRTLSQENDQYQQEMSKKSFGTTKNKESASRRFILGPQIGEDFPAINAWRNKSEYHEDDSHRNVELPVNLMKNNQLKHSDSVNLGMKALGNYLAQKLKQPFGGDIKISQQQSSKPQTPSTTKQHGLKHTKHIPKSPKSEYGGFKEMMARSTEQIVKEIQEGRSQIFERKNYPRNITTQGMDSLKSICQSPTTMSVNHGTMNNDNLSNQNSVSGQIKEQNIQRGTLITTAKKSKFHKNNSKEKQNLGGMPLQHGVHSSKFGEEVKMDDSAVLSSSQGYSVNEKMGNRKSMPLKELIRKQTRLNQQESSNYTNSLQLSEKPIPNKPQYNPRVSNQPNQAINGNSNLNLMTNSKHRLFFLEHSSLASINEEQSVNHSIRGKNKKQGQLLYGNLKQSDEDFHNSSNNFLKSARSIKSRHSYHRSNTKKSNSSKKHRNKSAKQNHLLETCQNRNDLQYVNERNSFNLKTDEEKVQMYPTNGSKFGKRVDSHLEYLQQEKNQIDQSISDQEQYSDIHDSLRSDRRMLYEDVKIEPFGIRLQNADLISNNIRNGIINDGIHIVPTSFFPNDTLKKGNTQNQNESNQLLEIYQINLEDDNQNNQSPQLLKEAVGLFDTHNLVSFQNKLPVEDGPPQIQNNHEFIKLPKKNQLSSSELTPNFNQIHKSDMLRGQEHRVELIDGMKGQISLRDQQFLKNQQNEGIQSRTSMNQQQMASEKLRKQKTVGTVHFKQSMTIKDRKKTYEILNQNQITEEEQIGQTSKDYSLIEHQHDINVLRSHILQLNNDAQTEDSFTSSSSSNDNESSEEIKTEEASPVVQKKSVKNKSRKSLKIKECSCESTVLIVDDNMFNLIPLELILDENFKLKVDKAFNGQEAVQIYTKNLYKTCCDVRYRLVLMDLNMPVMDGYQATIHILSLFNRKLQAFPGKHHPHNSSSRGLTESNDSEDETRLKLPNNSTNEIFGIVEDPPVVPRLSVVAQTAFVNDENIKECYRVGMVDVIHKPVSHEGLKRILEMYYYERTTPAM